MKKWEMVIKRIMDIIISILILLLSSPFLLIIIVAIRLSSSGPALFRQRRLGKNGIPYTCYKFRTMFLNSPDVRNPDGSTFNEMNDPRVTKVGNFLRKTSLDEFPQFINVIKGDMSLVGPRPDQVDQLQYYTEYDKLKLLVKPGVTGLAAVEVRNAATWEQRKKLDIKYVENQSLWLDISILWRTVWVVLLHKGVFSTPDNQLVNDK